MTANKSNIFNLESAGPSEQELTGAANQSGSAINHEGKEKRKERVDISNDISTILSLLSKQSDEQELKPLLKPELGGIIYILGENFEVTYEKLRPSEKKGLLKSKGFAAFSICSKCESLNLRAQLVCPECRSQAIFKSDLMIHYECQNTAPAEEFLSNIRGGYYCKKCRKDMKRVGIDYGNPGIGFKCSSCEKVFQFPLVLSHCESGHTSKIDELDLKSYPIYVLGDNAKNLSTLLLETQTLQKTLERKNIRSQVLPQLRGASGTIHVIPLLLTAPGGEQVAIDFVEGDSQASVDQAILQLLLKNADLGKMKMLIIIRGSAISVENIMPMINPQRLKVVVVPTIAADNDGNIVESLSEQIVKELLG